MGCGSSTSTVTTGKEPDDKRYKAEKELKNLKLHYFPIKGRAEFIRLTLAAAGVKYEKRDVLPDQWPELKEKEFGGNGLPALEVGNSKLYQSNAIARFIAKKTGLAGDTVEEMGQVDMMADTVQDIYDGAFKCFNQPDKMKEYVDGESFNKVMAYLNKAVKENKGKSLCGDKFTWADFKLFGIMEFIHEQMGETNGHGTKLVEKYSDIVGLLKAIKQDKKIAAYLEERNQPDGAKDLKGMKLHYFPLRARAEFIRIMLAACGVEYERKDVPQDKWPELKDKEYGGNGLPALEIGNEKIYQSNAIARFIARKTGCAGRTDEEMGQVDMMADTVQDIVDGSFKAFGQGEKLKDYAEGESFNKIMAYLNKAAKENKGKSLCGDKFTWADFKLYAILELIERQSGGSYGLDKYPDIAVLLKSIKQDPKVAEYLKNRPDAPF